MANKLRIKKSLRDFSSYSADKTDYRYRLNANELPFEYKKIFKKIYNYASLILNYLNMIIYYRWVHIKLICNNLRKSRNIIR